MGGLLGFFSGLSPVMKIMSVVVAVMAIVGLAFIGARYAGVIANPTFLIFAAVAVVVILLAFGGYLLFKKLRDAKRSKALTEEIAEDAGMEAEFMKGMGRLRENGVNLYAQPWFLVVGPAGSGKTMAIRNCGIPQVEGLEGPQQGEGGTKNMKWWFLPDAILLDTAGAVFMSEAGTGLARRWKTFLEHLKTSRRKASPINGVLLVVEAKSLLEPDRGKARAEAQRISEQLGAIQVELGVRFPVYFLVSKCDQIVGFEDYFSFATTQRAPEWAPEQLFGWSNESNPLVSDERFDGRSIRDHMGTLVGRLRRFRDSVMQTQAMAVGLGGTPEHRRLASADALFAFPEELGRLAPNLETYLSTIFGSTSGSLRQLFLRGVYFTSARQDGVRLNQSLADIGIDATQLPAVATRSGERSFFLSELFGKKMFRERGLATSLKGDVHKTRAKLKARLAIFGMVSLTAVLALIGWFGFQLDASVGRQRSYWVALADAVERGGLGLIQSISGYEVRTAQPDVSSLDLIAGRGLTENATVGDIYQTAADRAGSDFDVPLVFEPASAFASDPESERRRAVRALVLSQALAPAAQQARRSLGAPSLEWRRFDAVTALIRLETLARRERPADEVVEEGAPALIPGEIDVLALASELVLEPSEGEDQHPSLTVLEQAADAVRRVLEDPDYERSALADDLTDHGVVLLEDPSGGSSAIDLENSLRRLEQALLSGELREILGLKDEAAAFESVASRLVRFEAAWDEVGRQIARPIETSAQAATLRADLAGPVGTLVALGTELDGLEDRFTPARSFVSRFGTGAELSAFSAWGDAVAAWEGSLPTADENEAPEIAALRVRVASIGEAAQQAVVDRLQALVDGFRSDGGPGALLDFRAGASRRTYAARAASIAGAFERLGAAVDDHGLARDDRLGFASPGHLAATGPLLGPPERAPELAPGDPVAFVGSVAARQELANRAWRLIGRDPPGDEVGVQRVVDRLAASGYEQNVPALPYLDDVSPGDPRYSIPAASEVLGRWSGYLAALAAGSLDRSELSREVGGASDAFAGYASAFAGYWSGDGAYEAVRVEPGTVRRDTLGDLPRGSTVALELESFFAPARRVLEGLEPEGESSSAVELPSVDAAVVDRALRAWRDIGLRSNVDGWSRVVSQAMIDAVRRGDRDRDLLVESDPYTFSLERAFLILLDTRLRSGVDPEIAGLLSGDEFPFRYDGRGVSRRSPAQLSDDLAGLTRALGGERDSRLPLADEVGGRFARDERSRIALEVIERGGFSEDQARRYSELRGVLETLTDRRGLDLELSFAPSAALSVPPEGFDGVEQMLTSFAQDPITVLRNGQATPGLPPQIGGQPAPINGPRRVDPNETLQMQITTPDGIRFTATVELGWSLVRSAIDAFERGSGTSVIRTLQLSGTPVYAVPVEFRGDDAAGRERRAYAWLLARFYKGAEPVRLPVRADWPDR